MRKVLLPLLLVFLFLFGCTNPDNLQNQDIGFDNANQNIKQLATGHGFSDTVDHWARNEITYLSNKNIVGGYPNGNFGPNDEIQRVHAALMLQRELEFATIDRPNPQFADVSPEHPYYELIATLADEGIITGYQGNFSPNAPLTRAEMAAILQRAYGLEGVGDFQFRDVSTGFWGHTPIQTLLANQITVGYTDGSFRPNSNITRAEFSVFMARVLDEQFKLPIEDIQVQGDLTVHFLDVGQGDSSLLLLPNGKTVLIDAGTQMAGQKVVSYLKQAGISSIDLVVATHAHADHIGGLLPIFEEFEIKQVLDSGRTHTTLTYLNYLELIDQMDIPFDIAEVGTELTIDPSVKMTVLNTGSEQKSLNDSSVSLKIDYNQISLLFTGDAEQLSEGEMTGNFDLSSQILQVGHHGSRTSSNPTFLDNAQPEVAILSYGEGNRYNHPHDDIVQRLKAYGATVYSTADSGDIIVVTDGVNYEVKNIPWNGTGNEGGSIGDEDSYVYPVNINTANEEELQLITGVGPVIAVRIIDYRQTHGPFTTIEEVLNVSGIGTNTFERMKAEITT
ncbi:S-layer homology domain-containing protein [Bacillus sp. FJAT-45350]|uniref:S-layer homology domain-containing protein n=1 Tax=Bacillus sp. FJAT-45350 TaxID=2011014 RepID=UPI000BB6DF85|nr:S-layer homology domain-containing protein [Bacillus sp. FJAT-45350]